MNTQNSEKIQKARDIVCRAIHSHFPNDLEAQRRMDQIVVGDPIVVDAAVDEFGSDASGKPYLKIWIVYDGNQDQLDVGRTTETMDLIRSRLLEAGIEDFPSASWVEKSEWLQLLPKWRRSHPDTEGEPT